MWNDLIYVGAAAPLIIAIFVAVAVWRSASAQRTRRALQEGLSSNDPSVRHATLDAVDDDLLSRNAPIFLRLLETESDPDVLDALAGAVARSRWEPTDNANVVELRRWVAGRHAHATLDDVAPMPRDAAGPLGPPEDEEAPVSFDAQARADEDERAADLAGADDEEADAHDGSPGVAARTEEADAPSGLVAASLARGRREPVRPHLAAAGAMVPAKSSATAVIEPDEADLVALVPKVRELLGDDLARVELVSIDGRVLATWSSSDAQNPELN